ncbi:hypothetical protein A2U01_0020010, partial [Trifolium medium]|nr:hypothetical protein [Trifolium medium]
DIPQRVTNPLVVHVGDILMIVIAIGIGEKLISLTGVALADHVIEVQPPIIVCYLQYMWVLLVGAGGAWLEEVSAVVFDLLLVPRQRR